MSARTEIVVIFDGRAHLVAECEGWLGGLPVFGWGEGPATLLTKSQLADARGEDAPRGLRPGGQTPLALLRFRHRKPFRRLEVAPLFSVWLALPKREPVPGQMDNAMRARRTCVSCSREVGYCVPTSTRECWTCFDLGTPDLVVAA